MLALLILSPAGEALPTVDVDTGKAARVDTSAGVGHICGITESHFGPGSNLKVIKLHEAETEADALIPLPLRRPSAP